MTVPAALRNAAVHMYLNHVQSLRRVAQMMGNVFSKSALAKWLRHHPAARPREPCPRKVHAGAQSFLQARLAANPFATARQLAGELAAHLSITLHRSTATRWVRRLGYTRKQTYARALDTERIVLARHAFARSASALAPDDCLSVDETCVYFHAPQRLGHSRRGQRLHVPLHARGRDKYTLLLAIGTQGVAAWELLQGSANSRSFAAFVGTLPDAANGGLRHVLMDNAAFHKTALVREALARRNLSALFTPPYSPEFNP